MGSHSILSNLLADSPQPWEIVCLATVDSTNAELSRRYGKSKSVPRMILWSDEQTAGRGRLSRCWLSVPGRDITASACFPSPVAAADSTKLVLLAGLALVKVLREEYGIQAMARWPNDVVTARGKIAGILSSYLSASGGVICGIGINANSDPGECEVEPDRPRTTVRAEIGRDVSREELFAKWLGTFEEMWPLAEPDRVNDLRCAFDDVDFYRGRLVRVLIGAASNRGPAVNCEQFEGIASGLDHQGALLIIAPDREPYQVSIEDVLIPT